MQATKDFPCMDGVQELAAVVPDFDLAGHRGATAATYFLNNWIAAATRRLSLSDFQVFELLPFIVGN
jgi:hypothetical protein